VSLTFTRLTSSGCNTCVCRYFTVLHSKNAPAKSHTSLHVIVLKYSGTQLFRKGKRKELLEIADSKLPKGKSKGNGLDFEITGN